MQHFCIGRYAGGDQEIIELSNLDIALHLPRFDALRETKKYFYCVGTLLSGIEERERDLGLTYLRVREFRLQPGIDFYMEMPGLVEREAFFV